MMDEEVRSVSIQVRSSSLYILQGLHRAAGIQKEKFRKYNSGRIKNIEYTDRFSVKTMQEAFFSNVHRVSPVPLAGVENKYH